MLLEGEQLFRDHFVYLEREQGLPHVVVFDFAGRQSRRLPFPEPAYTVSAASNRADVALTVPTGSQLVPLVTE